MGLQDYRILSPLLAIWVLVLSPFVLGGAFFSVLIFFTFSAVIGCQHNLHQLEIRNKQKLKPQQQQQQKNQKKQNRFKTRQPNNSEVHSYLLVGSRARSRGQNRGHREPLAHSLTRRHAHGAPHSQKHRTAAHMRSDNTEGHYPLHTPPFPL